MAKIVAKELALQGHSVFFTIMDELVKKLTREGFPDADPSFLHEIRTAEFLVIDDSFDTRKMTMYRSGYQITFLDSFLRYRMETARLSTCFTSNTPPNKISEDFDRHIAALVKRNTISLEFNDGIDDFQIERLWED